YQSGHLVLVGSYPEGAAAISRCAFDRAMGLAARGGAQDSAAGDYIVAGRTGRYQPRARDAIKATREQIRRLANRRAAKHRRRHPWCGVTIVELASGNIIEWLRFHGSQTELFDVVAIAEIFCPSAAAP